ncbi:MAG TPA: class I adenylate-forming enzyme family protein [Bradyrhizobium sp.]|uniref:class I adenylate-forming enzyme family protein n=1 Tax=Bradyrhizobium sp. TaxID=376 RepID=UPI002D803A42|nr:class I adenylate-forming enzyme family protein [Bradyrhizobium sp.]HET7884869.1 class I adenylate-forming enzyme family protein [Bradyrhizobium sp.]
MANTSAFFNLGALTSEGSDLDKIAIIDLGTGDERRFSYRDFEAQADAVARALSQRGLARGDRIAILSANRFEYLTTVHGIMRAGFVAVPVNFKFPPATIDYIIHDSGAKLIFCDAQRLASAPKDLPRISFDEDFAGFLKPGPFTPVMPAAREAALFLYTSGSTGRPKGVVLSHQSHIWVVEQRMAAQDMSRHRFLVAAPLYHMNALAMSQLAHAAHATVILLPQFTTQLYLDAIEKYRCTWLTAVPPMIAMMLNDHDRFAATDLSSVEYLRMGSAPVSQSLLAAIHQALPNAAVTNAYGTTEGGPVVFGPHPQRLPQPDMSVGYPHPKVQVRLIGDDGKPSDAGVLEMKSPAIMNGYHNRPDVPSPITADGFYVTGDVFRRDENGFYFFVGRADDMFVSGGENIFPGEVEKMLESHPDVIQACVVPVDDDIKGTKPVAFVIKREGSDLDEAKLKAFSLANAPAYQHPRSIWFVDRLPLASTNKLDRKTLHGMAEERLRERTGAASGGDIPTRS